jgi:hypothetical protein
MYVCVCGVCILSRRFLPLDVVRFDNLCSSFLLKKSKLIFWLFIEKEFFIEVKKKSMYNGNYCCQRKWFDYGDLPNQFCMLFTFYCNNEKKLTLNIRVTLLTNDFLYCLKNVPRHVYLDQPVSYSMKRPYYK